jgi:hypothetical protein
MTKYYVSWNLKSFHLLNVFLNIEIEFLTHDESLIMDIIYIFDYP